MILCIDPGTRKGHGVAVFTEDGILTEGEFVPDVGAFFRFPARVLVEIPRVYPRSKVRPNDLIDLAFAAGKAVGAFDCPVQIVCPAEWKGQLSGKETIRRVESALTPTERARIRRTGAQDHNILDAVGIGLWYFKRLHKKVYPR